MNVYLFAAVFLTSCLMSSGELSRDEMKSLRDVEIAGTRTDTWKNDDREKYEVLEVNTFQNEDDPLDYDMNQFRIRMVVELTNKEKKSFIIHFTGSPSNNYDSEYMGEDYWKLYMAHGDLGRLSITGFAVQYGIMDEETFVPLGEEFDDVKSFDELSERTTTPFVGKFYLRHYFMYDDSTEGSTESIEENVRAIKE